MMLKGGVYLAFGDSTTWTIPAETPQLGKNLYSFKTWKEINKNYSPIKHVNKGYGGARASHVVERIDQIALGVEFDLVTIGLGMNDCNGVVAGNLAANLLTYESNMNYIIDRLREKRPNCDIILCKIMPTNDPLRTPHRADFNNKISEIAANKNCLVADFSNLYTDFTTYAPDGVHPNSAGHQKAFEVLYPVVQQTKFIEGL